MSSRKDRAIREWEERRRRLEANRDELIRRRDRLLAQIERDFADVTREGGVSIREAHAIDDYGSAEECAAARAQDTDTHWSEVELPELDPNGNALSFFDPIGFRYHIPAYMCAALRHGYQSLGRVVEGTCTDHVVWHLRSIGEKLSSDPPQKPEPFKYANSRYDVLSKPQRRCIARFLVFDGIMDEYWTDGNSSGVRFWLKFLPHDELTEAKQIWQDPR